MSKTVLVELSDALADAAELAGKSTVLVSARRRVPASGIVFAPELVITAEHVIEKTEDITVVAGDGADVPAKIAGRDAGTDLAVLRLERPVGVVAEITKSPARLGQFALALARPSRDGIEASLGMVSAVGGPIQTGRGGLLEQYYRTDSISYPGFSGGPLVAADGTILGLNTSGLSNRAAITIPADIAWNTAEILARNGKIKRGYLGIRSQTINIPSASQDALKRKQATGLLILSVEKDSPASRGELIVGDILVAVDGKPVLHHDELFARLNGDVVGKATPVEILRGGRCQNLDIVIGERE
jgi:serine protease DegQ